ncbi:MAG: beta-propeller fold lactonase family protein [Phycisphaerae bacterium]|nr:beta-propeller fold lactonase family protein [Phycisphaerae bacterium]
MGLGLGNPGGARPASGGVNDATTATLVNWETGHVHPVDMTPDRTRLLVCNTADNRLEVFDITTGTPTLVAEIPVGLDPISVRARTNDEVWVVNNISDSVSIVRLSLKNVVATLRTKDEPSDVVFAGSPQRAFVSCSQANTVQVFDPANLAASPIDVAINGEDPRALAVSPDGSRVYAAVFNSGNASTILGGGGLGGGTLAYPPNVVGSAASPYGTTNPPPNSGAGFSPPLAPGNPVPPRVGLIVKKNAAGQWMDDNNGNWTNLVSGPSAAASGRRVGWDMPDRDLAAIDASSLSVTYARGLMNICMAAGVNPATGQIAVVGTDGTNEVRFEPNVNGTFVRVKVGLVNPATLVGTVKDLNPHLTYSTPTLATQAERELAIGDPRGVVFNAAGTLGYVTGMGSNNVVVVNGSGDRAGLSPTIPVGEGPTGLALDEGRSRLYVLNRFAGTISVVSTTTEAVVATVPFYDPTPTAIKVGRKHLYDTHKTSGLGQASCASCHVDGRLDRLAWDLGDPSGAVKQLTGQNLGAGLPGLSPGTANPAFQPWHPMKGPMTTQTLQDIIGKEPLHWRGDRAGIEEFNGAFVGLLGDTVQLTAQEMQEFEDFLATIAFPPNPFRNFDNTLPTSVSLAGHYSPGRFAGSGGLAAGTPLTTGNAQAGLALYTNTTRRLDGGAFACVTCHTLPTGAGPDLTFNLGTQTYQQFPVGPMGEHHAALVSVDGSTNLAIKTPQIRNAYLKVGFEATQLENNAGFGFLHDGSVDSIARFVSEPAFNVASDTEVSDLVAFILCFSGGDLPQGSLTNPLFPPGLPGKDTHAAVGWQTTLVSEAGAPPAQLALISSMIAQAQTNKVGLVVKGVVGGEQRGFVLRTTGANAGNFQSDRAGQVVTPAALRGLASLGGELTYTVVPKGTETRIGIDRDEDGVFDRDQADLSCYANCDGSHVPPILNVSDFVCFLNKYAAGDPGANCDGSTAPPALNVNDFICFSNQFAAGCP